ncbi:PAS domain-containing sensor histidine kinase [Halostella litorea]|uniref:PAS domain-containing sensor histidine kinase n=1 Tax=Halostella litorea TaxID=2528831 RepID=UPI001092C186|nr:PAS domain-containing sensor histidine kinase [Halostella litorea]
MTSEQGAAGPANASMRAFQEAVENTGHAVYWTDTTGRIEYVNPAFEEQTGYTAEEAVGNEPRILQSGVHGDRFYERLWDTILGGDVWEGEIVNERKSGERYVARQTISPVTGPTGDIDRFVAVNEDITALRDYQERLEDQRNRLATLLDAVPIPLVLTEADGDERVVKRTNRAFRETFGFAEHEIGGSPLAEFVDDDESAHEVGSRVRQGDPVRREVTRRTADGESRTFLLTATPLDDDGTEAIATYIDITDRKRAEDELRRRTEELEDFADVVTHDLRNPLNVAAGHLDLLAEECDNPHVDTIRCAHTRMEELIENILMLAKQGKAIDGTEPVPVRDCVSRCWRTIETADATIDVETAKTVPADANRLQQLFGNLFRNAIEHGGESVSVTVGDLADGFYVADDGPGIPEAERSDVFESGYTSTESGTGFGLSIVGEIVEAHGWSVAVTESDAGGARFEVTDVPSPP